jgi:Zn ribbon nucleic-acid-binding protein
MRREPGELIRLIRELHEEDETMSYSTIARLLEVSRERVRVLWGRYGLSRPTAFNVHTGALKDRPRPIATCAGCGIKYEMRRWRRESKRHFHNMECFHLYRRHPDRLLKRAICKMCGNPVKSPGREAYSPEYCWACYGAHRIAIWEINKKKKENQSELTATATTKSD